MDTNQISEQLKFEVSDNYGLCTVIDARGNEIILRKNKYLTSSVIFLDIDGVLTTARTGYKSGDSACVKYLNRLTDVLDADIVITSTWKYTPNYADIIARWGVKAKIIGQTPNLYRTLSGILISAARHEEIQAWLDNYKPRCKFIIIDDYTQMEHLAPHLLSTQTEIGLTDLDVERGIKLYKEIYYG